jgi:hypothetical protein
MATLREWITRLRGALRRSPKDGDLEQELRLHLELAAEDARRGADSPERAARAARIQAGGIAQTMEALRDQRGLPWLTDLTSDLRYAFRMLVRNPGFTTVAVLTLALGIGANTAVFTVADALLLRPPPFDHSERLHWIYDVNDELRLTVNDAVPASPGNFVDWRDQNRSFDYMVAWRNWWFSVAGPSSHGVEAEQVRGVNGSPAFFDMLGVQAALGRTFRPNEEESGRDQVVVLTDGFWQRRFGGDPNIVGKTVRVDGRPFSIIGVLPSDFYFRSTPPPSMRECGWRDSGGPEDPSALLDVALSTLTETLRGANVRIAGRLVGCPQPAWISRPSSSTAPGPPPGPAAAFPVPAGSGPSVRECACPEDHRGRQGGPARALPQARPSPRPVDPLIRTAARALDHALRCGLT